MSNYIHLNLIDVECTSEACKAIDAQDITKIQITAGKKDRVWVETVCKCGVTASYMTYATDGTIIITMSDYVPF